MIYHCFHPLTIGSLFLGLLSCREGESKPNSSSQQNSKVVVQSTNQPSKEDPGEQWIDFRSDEQQWLGKEVTWVVYVDHVYGSQYIINGDLSGTQKKGVVLFFLPSSQKGKYSRKALLNERPIIQDSNAWSFGMAQEVVPKVIEGDEIAIVGIFTGLTDDGRCIIATTFAVNLGYAGR